VAAGHRSPAGGEATLSMGVGENVMRRDSVVGRGRARVFLLSLCTLGERAMPLILAACPTTHLPHLILGQPPNPPQSRTSSSPSHLPTARDTPRPSRSRPHTPAAGPPSLPIYSPPSFPPSPFPAAGPHPSSSRIRQGRVDAMRRAARRQRYNAVAADCASSSTLPSSTSSQLAGG
jgi:hypothetical protein